MARSLDGSSQYLYSGSAAATSPPIAMSCWFWADPAISQSGTLVSLTQSDPGDQRFELHAFYSPSLVLAITRDAGNFGIASTGGTYTTGAWHHAFAVWYTSTDRKVWLNGGFQGTNGTTCAPAGVAETCLGASRIGSPVAHFRGRLAEVGVWAGSGVENMGAAEAAILAKSFSPCCLGRWLGNLVFYQDLVRPVNRPGTGPILIEVGSPAIAPHPRTICPTNYCPRLIPYFDFLAFNPYHAAAAMLDAGIVAHGFATSAGAERGLTIPFGEVSV